MLAVLKKPAGIGPRALILVPTRELASQIYNVILRLTEHAPQSWQVYIFAASSFVAFR
jgi:superfamily II DNA/RNA helicase